MIHVNPINPQNRNKILNLENITIWKNIYLEIRSMPWNKSILFIIFSHAQA